MKGSGCLEAFLDTVSMDRGRRGGRQSAVFGRGPDKGLKNLFPIL
jgi:hypothetical protein